jgi:hypothetical protein
MINAALTTYGETDDIDYLNLFIPDANGEKLQSTSLRITSMRGMQRLNDYYRLTWQMDYFGYI